MKINDIYDITKKESFIYKSDDKLNRISLLIDNERKYLNQNNFKSAGIYIDNLFLQYFNLPNKDDFIKISNNGKFIVFPDSKINKQYLLRKYYGTKPNAKEYNLVNIIEENDKIFTSYPELIINNTINLNQFKEYSGNKINDVNITIQDINNFIKHIFDNEHLYNPQKNKRYVNFIKEEYARNTKLQSYLYTCLKERINNYNSNKEKLLHFKNDEGFKSGGMEIKIPFLIENKLVELPMIIIHKFVNESFKYELRTILDIPGVFPKAICFDGLETDMMQLSNVNKAKQIRDFMDKAFTIDKYFGIELLNIIELQKYYSGEELRYIKSPLSINKEQHFKNIFSKNISMEIKSDIDEIDYDDATIKDTMILRYHMNKEILSSPMISQSEGYKGLLNEMKRDNFLIENYYKLSKAQPFTESQYLNDDDKLEQFNYFLQDIENSDYKLNIDKIINKLPKTPLLTQLINLYEEKQKIKVLFKEPGKEPEVKEITNEESEIISLIKEDNIQEYDLSQHNEEFKEYLNESERKIKVIAPINENEERTEANIALNDEHHPELQIFGNVVFLGKDKDNNFTSLNNEEITKLKEFCYLYQLQKIIEEKQEEVVKDTPSIERSLGRER